MPLKHFDPFASKLDRLNATVNPYVATLREALTSGSLPVAQGAELKGFAGQWRERIAAYHGAKSAPRKLVVEVGCHKGVTLLAMAKAYPDTAFVAVDITFKRVITTAERAVAAGLKNVYCVMANANGLDQLFAPGEIDALVLFFPDPWVKKKSQAKNRLVSPAFCEKLARALSPEGFFWLKTDQRIYFDGAVENLISANFLPIDAPQPGAAPADAGWMQRDFGSAFESRFHAQDLPTFGARWRRPAMLYSV